MLAEQVALRELQLVERNKKLDEVTGNIYAAEMRIAQLQIQIAPLSADRDRLTADIRALSSAVSELQSEKAALEHQIEFMDYQYFLPDGTPADSPEKVARVRMARYKSMYFSAIGVARLKARFGRLFTNPNDWKQQHGSPLIGALIDYDSESQTFPFLEIEIDLWEEHGTEYPRWFAIQLIDSVQHEEIEAAISAGSPYVSNDDLMEWKALAIASVESRVRDWETPFDIHTLVAETQFELNEIRLTLDSNIARAELVRQKESQDPDDEIRVLENRMSHSLAEAQIHSSRANAIGRRSSVSIVASDLANEFRQSIEDEVDFLLTFDEKNL